MSCPKCGEPLVIQRYVDVWDNKGNPIEVYDYLVCRRCRVAWVPIDIKTLHPHRHGR